MLTRCLGVLGVLLLLSGCADKQVPTDSYCIVYTRVLPDREEVAALKRQTKEAILSNERAWVRDCDPRGFNIGPR